MNKDPFEELFGPASADEQHPEDAPNEVRQQERVKTSPLPTKPRTEPASEPQPSPVAGADRAAKAKPWIIVGLVTIVALIVSIVVINLGRADSSPKPTTSTTAAPTSSSSPSRTPSASEQEKPSETPEKPVNEAPSVDVGSTGDMDIPAWGVRAEISSKFGWPRYEIQGDRLVLSESPLINSLPDSCADMRGQWGIQRDEAGEFEVLKPATSCAAAPELFDEIWGLTAALVDTIETM